MQASVLCLVDDTHPTAAQLLDDAVVRDDLPDHWQRMLRRGKWRVNYETEFYGRCSAERKLDFHIRLARTALAGRLAVEPEKPKLRPSFDQLPEGFGDSLRIEVVCRMTIAEALEKPYARLERQLLQIAEAMPEDKYSFRPTPEVRTFGEQLRHVSAVQWVVAAALLETTPPVDVGDGDSGPPFMTAKQEVLNYARASFAYIRQAVRTLSDRAALEMVPHPFDPQHTKASQLGLIAGYLCHGWEHYGQMVVYQRMNGIIPPPSQPN